MAKRPTDWWRTRVGEEAALVARGSLEPDDAYASVLWSEPLISGTEAALELFDRRLSTVDSTSSDDISAAIKEVVLALNEVNRIARAKDRIGYETGEREQLCAHIDSVLVEAKVDVDAYAARQGIARDEITDEWREW